jgi:hypothetical protein
LALAYGLTRKMTPAKMITSNQILLEHQSSKENTPIPI